MKEDEEFKEDGITMKRLSEDITETNSFEDSASNSRLLVGLVLKSDFLVFISDFWIFNQISNY